MSKPDLFPFTVLSWNSAKIKRKWEPIQREIQNAVAFAEYEGVKRGHRRCDVYQLDPHSFDHQIEKVFMDGLSYLPILRSQLYPGFGHRHYLVEELKQDTFVYGVVGKTLEDAKLFKKASVGDVDHNQIGELLGYPKCCRDWFLEVWLKEGSCDPMYETALNTSNHEVNDDGSVTVGGNPKYNRLIRYFGLQAIPYFTCSYECKESEKFIDWFYGLMYEKAPDACEMLLEALNMPMKWSLNNLIIYIEHPLFRGAANGYWYPEKREVHWRSE